VKFRRGKLRQCASDHGQLTRTSLTPLDHHSDMNAINLVDYSIALWTMGRHPLVISAHSQVSNLPDPIIVSLFADSLPSYLSQVTHLANIK